MSSRHLSAATLAAALTLLPAIGLHAQAQANPAATDDRFAAAHALPGLADGLYALFTTPKGQFLARLEYSKAPLTVINFAGLAEGKLGPAPGKPFFDGLVFHRVVPGFVVQGGDPKGTGRGNPGYIFPNEIAPGLSYDSPGILGMANAGPDTNGSQFFITLAPQPSLDGGYSIFGRIVAGMDVVRRITPRDKMAKVEIIRVGTAATAFQDDQPAFDQAMAAIQEAAMKRAQAEQAAAQAADLATIATSYADLVKGEDGIYQKVLKEGDGESPAKGQNVKMAYKGMFLDGTVFDDSSLHGGSFKFQVGVGQVIPGWDSVVLSMKKGEKRRIILPPDQAYGDQGAGGVIPPNAFLVFELELLDIIK